MGDAFDALRSQRRRPRRRLRVVVGFLVGLGGVLGAFVLTRPSIPGWEVDAREPPNRTPKSGGAQLRDDYSNIHPGDYVGPVACAECHDEQYALWRSHPHSRMNQDADSGTVQGDFAGRQIRYGNMDVRFEREGDTFWMSLSSDDAYLRRRYRVTRTVGTRFTQMYIGVQTAGPEPKNHPVYGMERKLPFGFWTTRDRWLPANYFDSDFLPDYASDDADVADVHRLFRRNAWERNCIYCHNTYPYAARLRSGLAQMAGFPRRDLTLTPPASQERRLPVRALVTLGISCESCHFGGRAHAHEDEPIRFVPSAPDLTFSAASEALVEDARESPYVINSICAQCHSASAVSLYPNGAGTWNSREALDMLGGACANAIKCTDCHEPHTSGPPGAGPDRPEHVAACLGCHESFASDAGRAAHTRHGSDVTCLDCHMPRIVQGLDAVVRTHRISSPIDPNMLRQASPNACNLCHLDRSITWTLDALTNGWKGIRPGEDWAAAHGGSLEAPMGDVWLAHEVAVTRLVATDAYARAPGARAHLPRLLGHLNDSSPVNRMFALFAVERLLGRKLESSAYLPTANPKVRAAQIADLARSLD